jgi:leucyl aminopeptidase
MPLPEEYADHIDSDIADMKNTGAAGQAGSIAAAMLLARFTGSVPWVHLDIAGPARAAENSGYLTKGGTGFGVRTLLEVFAGYGTG